MLERSARNRRRSGILGIAIVLALFGVLANVGLAAAGTRDHKQPPSVSGRAVPATPGVSSVAPNALPKAKGQPSASASVQGKAITVQQPKSGQATTSGPDDPPPGNLGCTPFITPRTTPNGFGGVRIDYLAEILCNFYLSGTGVAYLFDRTPGSRLNGAPISVGSQFFFSPGFYGFSEGAVLIDGRLFEGGRQVEVVFDVVLQTLNGATWAGCFALPAGLRYETPCRGMGSSTISASVGTGTFNSGLPSLAAIIRDTPAINLINFHVSGRDDPASTARQNIVDAAARGTARTSTFSHIGAQDVVLDQQLLLGMLRLFLEAGYTYQVTAIAGGRHGDGDPLSRHYLGKAVDVDVIAGVEVDASNPFFRDFMAACRAFGATEVLGPGDDDHDTHVHCAWPR